MHNIGCNTLKKKIMAQDIQDNEIKNLIAEETERQEHGIELIASEKLYI